MCMQSAMHHRASIERFPARDENLLEDGHGGGHVSSGGSHLPQRPDARRFYAYAFSWILLIMGGFIAIICVGSDRFHEHPFGSEW